MLGHSVPRSTNLHCLANGDFTLVRLRLSGCLFGLASCSLSQIGLMPLTLCVRQIIPFIIVQSETKLALIAAKMIAHEIGVFSKINSLKRKSAETLTSVDGLVLGGGSASTARLRTPLTIHYYCCFSQPQRLLHNCVVMPSVPSQGH